MGSIEWSVMALAAAGQENTGMFETVRAYSPSGTTTELARHIMALEAIGEDAHDSGGVDYVKRLKETVVNNQFGDETNCVDDVFAGHALLAAGEPKQSTAFTQIMTQTLKCVDEDGGVSFAVGGPVDMDTTAAWLGLASRLVKKESEIGVSFSEERQRVQRFVRFHQNPDGGWGYIPQAASNSSTTAWMLMGVRSTGHAAKYMTTNAHTGFHFLKETQNNSGAVAYNTVGSQSVEILNTAYTVMALAGRPFPVNKPVTIKESRKK
jgi:hypothetical protein